MVRFSYTENPFQDLSDKVRHAYDLHQLLKLDQIQIFLSSANFEKMLNQVGIDDDKAIPNDKVWLSHHPSKSLFFDNIDNVWSQIRTTYNGRFKELLTGELPNEKVVLNSLKIIKKQVNEIEWKGCSFEQRCFLNIFLKTEY